MMDFHDARRYCEHHMNSSLITIDSLEEENFLTLENELYFFWIGVIAKIENVNGSLTIVETKRISAGEITYTNWDLSLIDAYDEAKNELCAEMFVNGPPVWVPINCEQTAVTLCQKPLSAFEKVTTKSVDYQDIVQLVIESSDNSLFEKVTTPESTSSTRERQTFTETVEEVIKVSRTNAKSALTRKQNKTLTIERNDALIPIIMQIFYEEKAYFCLIITSSLILIIFIVSLICLILCKEKNDIEKNQKCESMTLYRMESCDSNAPVMEYMTENAIMIKI
ncbi:hypothetical protein B4U79_17423 [Dinothrombium tinctorium]|nr:hypothetical protein B4U79_17423 [Dinothrombium tinctorium]